MSCLNKTSIFLEDFFLGVPRHENLCKVSKNQLKDDVFATHISNLFICIVGTKYGNGNAEEPILWNE